MKVMTSTNDGFVISEKDLELRGTGEFFGTKQHGLPEFKIANLFEDIGTLKAVQAIAIKIINDDPKLEKDKNKLLKKVVDEKFGSRIEIQIVENCDEINNYKLAIQTKRWYNVIVNIINKATGRCA